MLVLMYTWFGRANMREDRLIRIEQYIREKKSVSIDTLCEVFNVSKNTIRRDIAEIISRTDIRKTYGGVSAPYNMIPPSFLERALVDLDKKQLIGKYAAKLVNDNDIIYIDSGTTTTQMIDYLGDRKGLTVITHSLDVMNKVAKYPEIELVSLSGNLNRKTLSFIGQSTIDTLNSFNIAKAFMAANGMTIQNGATQSTSFEFAIKKTVVSKSSNVFLMIESRKLGETTLLTYCRPEDIDIIITEKLPDSDFCNAFEELGGEIIVAK